jgi:hypothetical protein
MAAAAAVVMEPFAVAVAAAVVVAQFQTPGQRPIET